MLSFKSFTSRRFVNAAVALGILLPLITTAPSPAQVSNPQDPQRQEALALEQQGKNAEAEAAWRAYLKTHPSDPEPYAQLGLIAALQENYKEAVPLYRKALAMNPHVQGLRLNLGLALFKLGDLKAALPEFAQALKEMPAGSPEAQRLTILIGMSHYGLAQYAEAVPLLKEAALTDSKNLPLRLALAHSCLWSKQYQCVLDVYHEILTLDSESAEADMLAGEALDEMKDSEGAIRMFRAAVAANPKEPSAHFGLGYLLWTQKVYPEAAKEFQAELDNDPGNAQSMVYLADTRMQLNQPEAVRSLLEKSVQLDPSVPLAHLDLGILLSDAGDNEAALKEFLLAEKLKPDDVNVHWRLGRLYRAVGKKDEAKAEFDKASSLNKAVDEELYKKIYGGSRREPESAPSPGKPSVP